MKLEEISDIYSMISCGLESTSARKEAISLRKDAFNATGGLIKLAFDTRRIDQETNYISRRGLQNYNRSEEFITEANMSRLKSLKKLKDVLEDLKEKYGREHEWQDSYCRILLDTLQKALRSEQKDGDFTDNQPGVGSFDYVEEMLYVRYRIELANVVNLTDTQLKKTLLAKDSELINKDVNNLLDINKGDVGKETYDTLLEKLFGGVRATKEHPEVERSVTITIKDKFVEEK